MGFNDLVVWHIRHEHYKEMSSKSYYVPLGILPKNENRGDEMVEIAAHHHQFVPVEESIEEHIIESTGTIAQIPKAIVHPLFAWVATN